MPSDIGDRIVSSSAFLLGSLLSKKMRDEGIVPSEEGERVLLIDADYLFKTDDELKEKLSQGYKTMVDYVKNTIKHVTYKSLEFVAESLVGGGEAIAELGKYSYDMWKVLGRYFSGEPVGIYEFRLNPITARFGYNKIQQIKEYGHEHYIVQSYGDRMVDLPFSGTTGTLFPPRVMIDYGLDDVRLSFAYYKLLEFEKFFLEADRMIVVVFFDFMMFGYLSSFNYTFDANNPRQVKFDFSVKFDPRSKFHLFSTDIGEYLSKLKGLSYMGAIPTTHEKIIYEPTDGIQAGQ